MATMPTHEPHLPARRSVRLKGYDYAQPGMYFVTICTDGKRCTLGRVLQDGVTLSPLGQMVRECWYDIPNHHARAELDAFVVMPNHVHGVLVLHVQPPGRAQPAASPQPGRTNVAPGSLAAVVRSFKSTVSRRARRELRITDPVWQRNYYEHVVRNDEDLVEIRHYIQMNPLRWALDRENPESQRAQRGCAPTT